MRIYKSPSIATKNASSMIKQQLIESQIDIALNMHYVEVKQRIIIQKLNVS